MSTRSLTHIKNSDGQTIVTMYRHMDGYPNGHGAELAQFLAGFQIVNGLGMGSQHKTANGMECLAAFVVSHFKTEAGQFYIYVADSSDVGEEYVYTVSGKPGANLNIKIAEDNGKVLFNGTPESLLLAMPGLANA